MKPNVDIIELMAQYNLTLRHLPETETSFFSYRGEALKENQEIVMWKTSDGKDWPMIKQTRKRKRSKEWLVIRDCTWMNTQQWAGAFEGNTPEEAVMKAIEGIEIKNK